MSSSISDSKRSEASAAEKCTAMLGNLIESVWIGVFSYVHVAWTLCVGVDIVCENSVKIYSHTVHDESTDQF